MLAPAPACPRRAPHVPPPCPCRALPRAHIAWEHAQAADFRTPGQRELVVETTSRCPDKLFPSRLLMQVGVRRAAGSWRWPRGPAVQAVSWQTRQAAAGEFGFVADLAGSSRPRYVKQGGSIKQMRARAWGWPAT